MSTAVPERGAIGAADIFLYSAGALGTGLFSTVPSVLLLYFCTEIIGIPALWAGIILFLPKLWSIVWDPYVGRWSDRTISRFGRRRPFIAAGAVGTAMAFILLFSPPPAVTGWSAIIWVGGGYWLLVTSYSLFAVPHVALPPEIAGTPAERSKLVGWRMTGAMLGVLAGGALAPMLIAALGGGRAGYAMMSLWIGLGSAAAMACPLLMLRHRDGAGSPAPFGRRVSPPPGHRPAIADPDFRALLAAYVLLLGAAGMTSAAAPYFITGALGQDEGQLGNALGVMLIITCLTTPLVARIGRDHDRAHLLEASMLLYLAAAAGIALCALSAGHWRLMLVAFGAAGMGFAGLQVLPYTLAAHLIHDRAARGAGQEGAMTGLWTAAEKIGLAISPLLTGMALTLVRGDSRTLAWPILAASTLMFCCSFLFLRRFRRATPPLAGSPA